MILRRFIGLLLATALLAPMVVGLSIARAVQTDDCADLAAYAAELEATSAEIEAQGAALETEMGQMDTWTEAEFQQVVDFYETVEVAVTAIQPPAIAAEFHAAFLEGITLVADIISAMQTSGPFAAFAFISRIEAIETNLAQLSLPLEEQCNVALYDHDDDGQIEVGPGGAGSGAVATVTPAESAGASADTQGGGSLRERILDALPVFSTPEAG